MLEVIKEKEEVKSKPPAQSRERKREKLENE